jgi:hypothetical protein
VVPGARRHDDHRHASRRRRGRDDRLGSVAARHPDDIRPAIERAVRQRAQVVARREHDRLDAAVETRLDEPGALRLSVARARIDQQDRTRRGRNARPRRRLASQRLRIEPERRAPERGRGKERRDAGAHTTDARPLAEEGEHDDDEHQTGSRRERDDPTPSRPGHCDPGSGDGEPQERNAHREAPHVAGQP